MLQTEELFRNLIHLLESISEQSEQLSTIDQFDLLDALIELQTATEHLNYYLKALSHLHLHCKQVAGALDSIVNPLPAAIERLH